MSRHRSGCSVQVQLTRALTIELATRVAVRLRKQICCSLIMRSSSLKPAGTATFLNSHIRAEHFVIPPFAETSFVKVSRGEPSRWLLRTRRYRTFREHSSRIP